MATTRLVAQPNWASPVVEQLSWLTDVQIARNGSEHRIALRDAPRRTLRYAILDGGDSLNRQDADAWGWRGGPLGVPIWPDAARLSTPASMGSTTLLLVDASNRDIAIGRTILLLAPSGAQGVMSVESIAGNTVTVAPLARAWPSGTRVVPMRAGTISSRQTDHITAGVATGAIEFELTELDPPPAGAKPPIYRGLDVDTRRPDRASPVPVTLSRVVERTDSETGVWIDDDQYGRPVSQRTLNYILTGRSDIAAYRAWLHRRQGRAVAFWQPTWQSDLRVIAAVVAGATALTVASVDYADRYAFRQGRRDVALWHRPTQALYTRRIVSVASGGDSETFTLEEGVPVAGAASDWLVSWLELVRLDSDDVEIAWTVPELARVAVGVREMIVEPPRSTGRLLTQDRFVLVTEDGFGIGI